MKKTDAWSSYWMGGNPDSFVPKGMEKPFAEIWISVANNLPEGASVLDACCGNGAIAHLLEQAYTAKSLSITGVDAAVLDAKTEYAHHNVTLIGQTDVAALPFEDAQYDAVISQFGIEYSDWKTSLTEVARVCRAGGQVVFLVHANDSAISATSQHQLEALETIQQSQFFTKYAEFFELLDEVGDATQIAAQIRMDELNKELAGISKLLADKSDAMGGSGTIVGLLEFANQMFEQRASMSLKEQLERLAAAELMNMAGIERMKNMLEVSMDSDTLSTFVTTLNNAGIKADSTPINLAGSKVGYMVHGIKHG